jgi:hypothetical protein
MYTYRDEQQAIEITTRFAECGRKIVVQHIYPTGVLNDGAMWIHSQLLSYLNNKANLADLVHPANVSTRHVTTPEEFLGNKAAQFLPIVVKAATDLSSGGGADVALCRHTASRKLGTVGWPVSIAEAQSSGVGVCMPNLRPDLKDYVGPAGFLYDSIADVARIVSKPFPEELRQLGFEQARKSDVFRHKQVLINLREVIVALL